MLEFIGGNQRSRLVGWKNPSPTRWGWICGKEIRDRPFDFHLPQDLNYLNLHKMAINKSVSSNNPPTALGQECTSGNSDKRIKVEYTTKRTGLPNQSCFLTPFIFFLEFLDRTFLGFSHVSLPNPSPTRWGLGRDWRKGGKAQSRKGSLPRLGVAKAQRMLKGFFRISHLLTHPPLFNSLQKGTKEI